MTLVELLIASTLLIVLLTSVMITMNLLNTVTTSVGAQYQEYDQAIPALSPLQNLLRAEVEPGPAIGGVPQPAFSSVGNFSLTFYANIGTAYNNVTSAGTTGGPALIKAQELQANGTPVTSSTQCNTTSLCSFQVVQFLPVLSNAACPSGTPAGTVCSWCPLTAPSGTACQYPTTGKLIVNVLGVVNDPSQQQTYTYTLNGSTASGTGPSQPIFTYNVLDSSNQADPALGVGANWSNLTTPQLAVMNNPCTGNTVATCPADYIQSVGVDLMVARKGAGTNGTVDEQTIIYRYAGTSGTFPFQYTSVSG